MRRFTPLFLLASALVACQTSETVEDVAAVESALPYSEAQPDEFIARAAAKGRPSLVMVNFSLTGG